MQHLNTHPLIAHVEGKMYKTKIDGSETIEICDDVPCYISVVDNWIYYLKLFGNGNIYKIKTDGTENTKIVDNYSRKQFAVVGDWIYYMSELPSDKGLQPFMFKLKNDGSNLQQID